MGITTLAMAASAILAFELDGKVRTLTTTVEQQALLIKRNDARLASRDETVRILTEGGNDLVLVRLAANEATGPGMQVFWNVKDGTAVVHASGFKQVAANRTYCLWLIRDGKPVPVKLFNPDPDGHRLLNGVEVPKNMQGIAAFAVTEEPAEGSPQPTMTPFLVGAVAPKEAAPK
jgi:anti-sigma-K factor RskA